METKTCYRCKTEKPATEFRMRGDGRGLDSWCRVCFNEYHRDWERKNSERVNAKKRDKARNNPEWVRAKQIKTTYGISYDEYLDMCEDAQGLCEICERPWKSSKGKQVPDIDHDHNVDDFPRKIRGLLCHACNSLIGLANDDPEICEKAAAYLRRTVNARIRTSA